MKKLTAIFLLGSLVAVMLLGCAGADIKLKEFDWNTPQTPEASSDATTNPSKPSTTKPGVIRPTDPSGSEPEPSEPEQTEPTPPQIQTGVDQGIYTRAELDAMDRKVNGWGLGPHTDENNRPLDAVRAQEKFGDREAYFIFPDNKIYLTFDEGYENGFTSQILDVLKEKDVKAVFFVTMQYVKDEPELIQRMIDEGHVVGNHSVRHKSMPTLSVDEMIREVVDLHDYVQEHFGYQMTLFRPPMGEYSEQSLSVLQNLGYKSIMWSFAHYDYAVDDQPEHQATLDKILNAAHGGAIYLLHAVSETNTAVLGDVIDGFRAAGYELELMQ